MHNSLLEEEQSTGIYRRKFRRQSCFATETLTLCTRGLRSHLIFVIVNSEVLLLNILQDFVPVTYWLDLFNGCYWKDSKIHLTLLSMHVSFIYTWIRLHRDCFECKEFKHNLNITMHHLTSSTPRSIINLNKHARKSRNRNNSINGFQTAKLRNQITQLTDHRSSI